MNYNNFLYIISIGKESSYFFIIKISTAVLYKYHISTIGNINSPVYLDQIATPANPANKNYFIQHLIININCPGNITYAL